MASNTMNKITAGHALCVGLVSFAAEAAPTDVTYLFALAFYHHFICKFYCASWSPPAQKQLVQLIQAQLRPGGAAMIALAAAFGDFHVTQ